MNETKDTQDHILTDVAPESGVGSDAMMIRAQDDSTVGSETIPPEMTLTVPEYSQPDSDDVSGSRPLGYLAIESSGTDASPDPHTVSGPSPNEPPTVVPHTVQASPGIAFHGSTSGIPGVKAQATQNDSASRETPRSTGSASAEKLTKLIESYCDPTRWASNESQKDWNMYETEDPIFDDNAFGDEDPDDTEDHRKFLYHRERVALLTVLSNTAAQYPPGKPPPAGSFVEAVRQWMPKGLLLSSRLLLAAVHPDRFQKPELKKEAHAAFSAIKGDLEQNPSETSKKFEGFNQSDDIPMDFLEEYHEKAHIDATSHLKVLYKAWINDQIMDRNSPHLTDTVRAAYRDLDVINKSIEDQNTKVGNEPEFGMIYPEQMIQCWKLSYESEDPSMLWKLCEARHYPMGWTYEPPLEEYSYDLDRGQYWTSMKDRITTVLKKYWDSSLQNFSAGDISDKIVSQILKAKADYESQMISLNQSHKRPDRLNIVNVADIMAHYCGLKVFSKQMMTEQFTNLKAHLDRYLAANDLPQEWSPSQPMGSSNTTSALQVKQLGNGKAVIKSMPHTVDCTVKPGYTTSGEKIIAMQKIGAYSARFVTESEDGSRRIVDSGQAGGKLAMEGASKAGVPFTTTSYGDIAEIKAALHSGESWGLTYVAVSQWDTTRTNTNGQTKLPYTVVGLFLKGSELHVSKSVLTLLVGASAAEKNIVRCLGGDEDNGLSETLKSRLPVEDFPHLLQSGASRSLYPQQSLMAQQDSVSQEVSRLREDVDGLLVLRREMEKLTAAVTQLVGRMRI
ncbi:hypothetical protein ZTR_09038 [Talaromyces verruculosus]|nr:hypothetical protein ZTR_09038 [Talaromyces verruculosus]